MLSNAVINAPAVSVKTKQKKPQMKVLTYARKVVQKNQRRFEMKEKEMLRAWQAKDILQGKRLWS